MRLMSHIEVMTMIEIPIRELHARTGHFVRLAARNTEVIVTERGQPTARLSPIGSSQDNGTRKTLGEQRRLRAGLRLSRRAEGRQIEGDRKQHAIPP